MAHGDPIKNLKRIRKANRKIVKKELEKGGETVKKAMQSRAPIGPTGDLREGITTKTFSRSRKAIIVKIGPSRSEFYARFIEFGTSKLTAKPFLRPAWDSVARDVQRDVGRGIFRRIQEETI